VPIGVSTGHPNITASTIGARVIDGEGNIDALSNNHVYADENQAAIGDNVRQQGIFDGGVDPDDSIGTLAEFEPIMFAGTANTIDAAIALSSSSDLGNTTLSDGYGTPNSTINSSVRVNEKVKKYGRTTDETKGFVWAFNASVNVGYSKGMALFVNQIIFRGNGTFSAGGDSGSLIVTQKGGSKPVALLFNGSSQCTIGNPIEPVLQRFGVTIDGQ